MQIKWIQSRIALLLYMSSYLAFIDSFLTSSSTFKTLNAAMFSQKNESTSLNYGPTEWFSPLVQPFNDGLSTIPSINPSGGVYVPHYDIPPELIDAVNSRISEKREIEHDQLWERMRDEAKEAAVKEPLLVSFIYSTILNQKSLEDALVFHLANKLAGPNMRATQLQGLLNEFAQNSPNFSRSLRRDMVAVRERDPACTSYHDALLYFKGFQALQTYRASHFFYENGRRFIAQYLQGQVNQHFQIDIHPASKIGEGVFIDHGTGIVIGETASIGNDCSILHQVTLGGSGIGKGDRHPKVGNDVLIGAGACLVGGIRIGNGVQIGACSLVVESVDDGCVVAGVPARILGMNTYRNPAKLMKQDFFDLVWGGMDI